MTDRNEIYRAAAEILERYGSAALVHAITQIDELAEAGDIAAANTWSRILEAINELTDNSRPPCVPLH